MNPAQELAKAAETLDAHQVTMVPGLDQVLAMVLRGAADTIVNNVTRRLPDGLPIVPVSPDLLDLARLINASTPAEPAPADVVSSEPQPVDRDALIHAMTRADRRPVKPESAEWRQFAEETYGRLADAVLALINGSES